jgi:hypothetical protein
MKADILIDLAKTGLLGVTKEMAHKIVGAIKPGTELASLNWGELEKDFKTNKDKLGNDFIKLEYAKLYVLHLMENIAHKNDVGVAELFFKNDGELVKMSPVEEYCSREALLNLIVENNKRLLIEIETLLHKNET